MCFLVTYVTAFWQTLDITILIGKNKNQKGISCFKKRFTFILAPVELTIVFFIWGSVGQSFLENACFYSLHIEEIVPNLVEFLCCNIFKGRNDL